jgi:hypothetical protein
MEDAHARFLDADLRRVLALCFAELPEGERDRRAAAARGLGRPPPFSSRREWRMRTLPAVVAALVDPCEGLPSAPAPVSPQAIPIDRHLADALATPTLRIDLRRVDPRQWFPFVRRMLLNCDRQYYWDIRIPPPVPLGVPAKEWGEFKARVAELVGTLYKAESRLRLFWDLA